MTRPVLFLDFDDVICCNQGFGGYDVIKAMSEVVKGTAQLHDFSGLWTHLFDVRAVKLLTAIHAEFNPLYVLSTSWRLFLNRAAFQAVLVQTGLGFVFENLHADWQTPQIDSTHQAFGPSIRASRADEISAWLKKNQDCKLWAALDDELSGTGLTAARWRSRVVLCKEDVGFGDVEYGALRRILGGHSGAQNIPRGAGEAVLYLDFDGVLHHENVHWHSTKGPYIKDAPPGHVLFQHVDLLVKLLAPYPLIRIVLSTSWVRRYGCAGAAKRLPMALRERVIGATFHSKMDPVEFYGAPRGMQVWGDVVRRKPAAAWLALDDDYLHWPKWALEHYVRTHEIEGISNTAVMAAIEAKLALMCAVVT